MDTACPICNSNEVEKITIEETVPIPFCGDAVIPHVTFKCNNCEEEGDFDNFLDKDLTSAIDKANIASAPKLMSELTKTGITMTYLEKALRLPFRTTSRWKLGKISHSALALLRLIRCSPQLLEVADDNFSPEAVARYHITRPVEIFEKYTSNPVASLTLDANKVEFTFTGSLESGKTLSVEPGFVLETEKC